MAGNTRGKLKEKFESVHRNFEWIKRHLAESLDLIDNKNPSLSTGIKSLSDGIDTFDKLAQEIYSRI